MTIGAQGGTDLHFSIRGLATTTYKLLLREKFKRKEITTNTVRYIFAFPLYVITIPPTCLGTTVTTTTSQHLFRDHPHYHHHHHLH